MSKQICEYCKHRPGKNICGFSKSPFYNQTIEKGETTCQYFQENPAIDLLNGAMASIIAEEADERMEEIINDLTRAIEIGLPEDEEVKARTFLSRRYDRKAVLNSEKTGKDLITSREMSEAFRQLEKAVEIDAKGSYGFFLKPFNRSFLQRYDALYASQTGMIEKQKGVEQATQYAEEKVRLFSYLPTNPLLLTLLTLGNFYGNKNDLNTAKRYFQEIVNAEPIAMEEDQYEWEFEKETRRRAQERLQNTESPKKEGGCYIATACYGSYNAYEVRILRQYRDETLSQSSLGRILIRVYYTYSPYIADRLKSAPTLNRCVKTYILDTIVTLLNKRR